MSEVVHFSRRGAVGVVTIDYPPVNGLGHPVRVGLLEQLTAGLTDPEISAFVITGGGRMFSAGADIREFGKPVAVEPPTLPEVIDTAEDSAKPVIAAIHGVAAGGGLELALGCHYRVAAPGTRVGQPEVSLGIIPGAGGTQRLPRLIGVQAALEMIVKGNLIPVKQAVELGVIDELLEGDLIEAAVAFAEQVVAEGEPPRRAREMEDKIAAARDKPEIFEQFRVAMAKQARGFVAPYAGVDCIEAAVNLPFDEGIKKERETFAERVASDESKAMRHAFFAERQVAKIPDVPKETPTQPIERAAVIGCGTMGVGITMNFASAGIPVHVLEVEQEDLDRGLAAIEKNYASSVSKGRISRDDLDERRALITGTLEYADLADADIVIEAVFEEMDIKKQVFAKLDEVCKPQAILTTNTSTLDVNEIASAVLRPERVMGTHFFSPAHVMKLMENVRGDETSKETIATVMKLSKVIGKVGVLVGVCDGFVGNRMLYAYSREASFLLEEGALPQQVDKVIYDFGFPMGPFTMFDLAGLDVGWRIRKRQAATRPKEIRYSPVADRICEMGRFGQKTGAGWYRYEGGSREPIPDPEIEELIVSVSEELGIERREIGDEEILKRCIYPMINEGAKILEEGIALRPGDIDVIWLYGYGFPRYRGGPMFYADTVGVEKVYQTMCAFESVHGEPMKPASLLEKLAEEGKGFGDLGK